MLVAMVVVPTPPFGLNTATVRRARAIDRPSAETTAGHVARALEPEEQRLDAGLELAAVERLGHDVVGAGLEERDPLVDVVGLADAQDRDADHGRVGTGSRCTGPAAVIGPTTTSMMTSWWAGGVGERAGRVGGACDGVARAGQDGRDGLGRRPARRRGAGWSWRARSLPLELAVRAGVGTRAGGRR